MTTNNVKVKDPTVEVVKKSYGQRLIEPEDIRKKKKSKKEKEMLEHELSKENIERLESVFSKLDKDNSGSISIQDLQQEFSRRGLNTSLAKSFIDRNDEDKSGDISLEEFLKFAKNHEKKLKLIFTRFDSNSDGVLDKRELKEAFRSVGIHLTDQDVNMIMKRISVNGQERVEISWEDWRDFLILSPSAEIQDVVQFWRLGHFDVGEDTTVPDDFTQLEFQTGIWWRNLVAGGIAGAVSRSFTAPLDRIKVYLQVHGGPNTVDGALAGAGGPRLESGKKRIGIRSCYTYLIQEGGVRSLWRGNGVNVLKIAPESALKFMAYEQIKRYLKKNPNSELRIGERFIAGSLAGAISQSAIYPLEVVKTRLALRKSGEFKSALDMITKMWQKEGLGGFYRGYVPNLIGILPYAGIDLAIYETLKKFYLKQNREAVAPPTIVLLSCGTISSACGQICSYPLALVRTRLQAQTSSISNKTSMTILFKSIIREEGVNGLYRGMMPNFLKVAPAVSISYVVYENVRIFLGVQMS